MILSRIIGQPDNPKIIQNISSNIEMRDNIIINGCQGIDMCIGMGNVMISNNLISIGRMNNNLISKLRGLFKIEKNVNRRVIDKVIDGFFILYH